MHKMYPLFLASYNEKMHVHNKNRHKSIFYVIIRHGKEEMKMKKFILKYGSFVAALALLVTTMTENSACIFYMHQEKLPESAKKLRKF